MKVKTYISWIRDEDKLLIINSEKQKCLILDEISEEIWNYVKEEKKIEGVIERLTLKYNQTNKDIISKDVKEFYELLLLNDILDV